MAGMKGRSGGPRPNSGGARPGAGCKPKPKEPQVVLEPHDDPLEFLLAVQNNVAADPRLRVRAAITAVQYKHTKRGDGGKREEAAEKAEKAASGRFAAPKPPLSLISKT